MGLCLRIARTTLQVLIQARWSQQQGHKTKKLQAHSKSPAWKPWAQLCRERAEGWISSSPEPWRQLFTQPSPVRVVFVTGFKPRAYLHQSLHIRARGPSQNLFIGHFSVGHVFSSSLGGGVSPPPVKYRNAVLAGPVSRGSTNTGLPSPAASSSLLSHQWMIAVWGLDWFCLGFWDVEGLEMSPGNEEAINRQITKRKGKKKKKKLYFSYLFLRCAAGFFKIPITQRELIGFLLILLQIIKS